MAVQTKEGYLLKYTNMFHGWVRRYCKLDRNYLHNCENQYDVKPKSSKTRGDIVSARSLESADASHPHSFQIEFQDGTVWHFRANTKEELDSWLAALTSGPTHRTVKDALATRTTLRHEPAAPVRSPLHQSEKSPGSGSMLFVAQDMPSQPPPYNPSWQAPGSASCPAQGAAGVTPGLPHPGYIGSTSVPSHQPHAVHPMAAYGQPLAGQGLQPLLIPNQPGVQPQQTPPPPYSQTSMMPPYR